jgi:excisionase family DNA binding protein
MNELLTSRQVQEILKVDRITVYRMLNDGRLKGTKIGQQWRFSVDEVERLLGINAYAVDLPSANPDSFFPAHCIQTIQDLIAEVSQLSAVVIDMDGNPLTELSNPTDFHKILASSPGGKSACRSSWQMFSRDSAPVEGSAGSKFFTCFAGLHYVGAPIMDRENQVGLFLVGQFYWQSPDPREEGERIRRLAQACNLSQKALQDAAGRVPLIAPEQHARVESWPFTAARAVQSILRERIGFMERLQQIADLTHL